MIICVTGMPGSGKSAVAEILRGIGYRTYELGDMVREEMRKRGIKSNPKTEKAFSIYMRRKYGKDVTSRLLVRKLRKEKKDRIAIIGFRSNADLNYVKKYFDAITIAVVAPAKDRFERTKKRKRSADPKTMHEFLSVRDKKEERFGIASVIKNADYVISNTSTIADLKKSVQMVIEDAGLI
jgi:dephospho-CoA kinase